MGRCRYCGRSGIFLSVDKDGLCARCKPIVTMDLSQRVRHINESIELVEKSKNLSTRLSRCDFAIQELEYLRDTYERREIDVLSPSADEQIAKLRWARDECVVESVQTELEKAKLKAQAATTIKARVNAYTKALLSISEGEAQMQDPSRLASYEVEVKRAVHSIQLSSYLEAAEKAEFKGDGKKALDQYQEALYFLKKDDLDDQQQAATIAQVSAKIVELGGSIP